MGPRRAQIVARVLSLAGRQLNSFSRASWLRSRALFGMAATGIAIAVAVGIGEVALRVTDGYSLTSLALVGKTQPRVVRAPQVEQIALNAARALVLAPGVDAGWFAQDPPPTPTFEMPAWARDRAARYPADAYSPMFEFNRAFLRDRLCRSVPTEVFGNLEDFLYFTPPDDTDIYPSYRHPRRFSAPGWFTTNGFGWRGPELALNKPPNVVRIAFVGASTTVNQYYLPYSYPEFVGRWLTLLGESRGWPIRIEIINAGRTGIDSHSIAAIVRQELLPVRPDFVVYYEGANQFIPGSVLGYRLGRLYQSPVGRAADPGRLSAGRSALAARVRQFIALRRGAGGDEPAKPIQWLQIPSDVDPRDPDPDARDLPMELPAIVRDLDAIRRALSTVDGELVMTSFAWMVRDGLRVNVPEEQSLFDYLNGPYWPVSYANMRRMADLQNVTFRNFARKRSLPFIDVAAEFPMNSRLFGDAIHLRYPGIRLHAWVVFQHLARLIEQRLGEHRLPRSVAGTLTAHPAFDQPSPRVVTRAEILSSCR
jgi:hypothetical protein